MHKYSRYKYLKYCNKIEQYGGDKFSYNYNSLCSNIRNSKAICSTSKVFGFENIEPVYPYINMKLEETLEKCDKYKEYFFITMFGFGTLSNDLHSELCMINECIKVFNTMNKNLKCDINLIDPDYGNIKSDIFKKCILSRIEDFINTKCSIFYKTVPVVWGDSQRVTMYVTVGNIELNIFIHFVKRKLLTNYIDHRRSTDVKDGKIYNLEGTKKCVLENSPYDFDKTRNLIKRIIENENVTLYFYNDLFSYMNGSVYDYLFNSATGELKGFDSDNLNFSGLCEFGRIFYEIGNNQNAQRIKTNILPNQEQYLLRPEEPEYKWIIEEYPRFFRYIENVYLFPRDYKDIKFYDLYNNYNNYFYDDVGNQ